MTENEKSEFHRKKRWLKRYRKNRACLFRLEEKLAQLDERLYRVKAPNYSGMPRGGTAATIEDLLTDKTELEARINRFCVQGRRIKAETLEKIDELEDSRHAEVLEYYFIDCLSMDEIAELTGYTNRHVFRLYSEAIGLMSLNEQ